jgi:hypothetical protein
VKAEREVEKKHEGKWEVTEREVEKRHEGKREKKMM